MCSWWQKEIVEWALTSVKCCIVEEELEKLFFNISSPSDSQLKPESWSYSPFAGYINENRVKPLISIRKTGAAGVP